MLSFCALEYQSVECFVFLTVVDWSLHCESRTNVHSLHPCGGTTLSPILAVIEASECEEALVPRDHRMMANAICRVRRRFLEMPKEGA